MNKKLIAAAVSAAVMAPVASQADATVYGRINNAIDLKSPATGDGTTAISSISSRFGVKASSDIGNGLTAHGKYEFDVKTDKEQDSIGQGGVTDVRVATVGLSGSFGSVNIGNQWSAYFDTLGTLISPTYTLGYYIYSSIGGGPYRSFQHDQVFEHLRPGVFGTGLSFEWGQRGRWCGGGTPWRWLRPRREFFRY